MSIMAWCAALLLLAPACLAIVPAELPEQYALAREFRALTDPAARLAAVKAMAHLKLGENDDYYHLDKDGGLFVTDPIPPPGRERRTQNELEDMLDGRHRRLLASSNAYTSFTANRVPILHSKPGASRAIFLNFMGGYTSTVWGTFNVLPYYATYSTHASTFSGTFADFLNSWDFSLASVGQANAQRNMALIWDRVAEDYIAFDVDVTTVRPTSGTYVEVCITSKTDFNNKNTPASNAGGVAYLFSFGSRPCWVTWDNLGGGTPHYNGEAASHEVGHTLGLNHDNDVHANYGYYYGHCASGTNTWCWSAIMGVGYYVDVSHFTKSGEYSAGTNTEDDLAIINTNYLPLRADDAGDTVATATPLALDSNGYAKFEGVIGLGANRARDVDVFSVNVATQFSGTFNVNVFVAGRGTSNVHAGTNLNSKVTVRNAAGTIVCVDGNVALPSAACSVTNQPGGVYYVTVEGEGDARTPVVEINSGGTYNDDMYSAYGSLGQYDLVVDLTITGCTLDSQCNDNNVCTSERCNVATGQCEYTSNDGLSCSNNQFCDGTETCRNSACVSSGNPCAANQVCLEGSDQCVQCAAASDCADDGNVCTATACVNNVCQHNPIADCCLSEADCLNLFCVNNKCTPCNQNGRCDLGEDCNLCPDECVGGTSGAVRGNGICEAANGETCTTAPEDCNGKQTGKPSNQFCCGRNKLCDGDCNINGWSCTTTPVPVEQYCCGGSPTTCNGLENSCNCALDCGGECCGDGTCSASETVCSCPQDCGNPPAEICNDGVDNDCDGKTDCSDSDCAGVGGCPASCANPGESCKGLPCCSGTCIKSRGSASCSTAPEAAIGTVAVGGSAAAGTATATVGVVVGVAVLVAVVAGVAAHRRRKARVAVQPANDAHEYEGDEINMEQFEQLEQPNTEA